MDTMRLASEQFSSTNALNIDDAPFVEIGKDIRARYGLCPTRSIGQNAASARTHSKKQIAKIARSMEVTGPLAPVILDEHITLLAGAARVAACQLRGLLTIPAVQVFGLTEAQKRLFLLSDNRIGMDAGWDREKLAVQLPELQVLFEASGIHFEDTGFEVGELEEIKIDFEANAADAGDQISSSILHAPSVLQLGDLILLGNHRLLVGDARDPDAVDLLCKDVQPAAAFLDPPYNVSAVSIGGRGRIKHADFVMASGELSRQDFVRFLIESLSQAARVSKNGAVHFVCMDGQHIRDLIEAGENVYGRYIDLVTWVKTNAGQGGLYRKQSEFILVFRVGDGPSCNNVQKGRFGRNRSNVWTYAGANTFRAGRMADLGAHPTVKPLRLVAEAMKDVTAPGDAILDTFVGSGTTMLAAERVGRRALVMEMDPKYADVAVRRWEHATGRDAYLAGTEKTFGELAAIRVAAAG